MTKIMHTFRYDVFYGEIMIIFYVVVSSKGFPLFEQYFSSPETLMDDQTLVDTIIESFSDKFAHTSQSKMDIPSNSSDIQIFYSKLSDSSWLLVGTNDPINDFSQHPWDHLEEVGRKISGGDPLAIQHVLSEFENPF